MTKAYDRESANFEKDQIGETWLPVVGFDGYKISDKRRVISYWRSGPNSQITDIPRLLHIGMSSDGYYFASLIRGKERKKKKIHIMLLEAFVGPRPKGLVGRHLNDIKTDNRLENLAWGTHKDNSADMIKNDKMPIGSDRPNSKLSEDIIRNIRKDREFGDTYKTLAYRYDVSTGTIEDIVLGRKWKHVK